MKNNGKHFNHEQRKIIAQGLSHSFTARVIAELLSCDPSSISKEVKRNRKLFRPGKKLSQQVCHKMTRFPYVCNSCTQRYSEECTLEKYVYDSKYAQAQAELRLKETRSGINQTPESFRRLDETLSQGIKNKDSVYHTVKTNPELEISVSTAYRYVNKGLLSVSRMDLPYAVSLKRRKKTKKYDYSSDSPIDRNSRTFIDFLVYRNQHPGKFHVQLDFLGKIKTDLKTILTLIISDLHFPLLFLLPNETAESALNAFNQLEEHLSIEGFMTVFPCILTDRDPCFKNYHAFEFSPVSGEQRTTMYYCDAYRSTQKASIENINKQLRLYFPKGQSIDHLSEDDVAGVNQKLINKKLSSLNERTPRDAFVAVYGQELFKRLFLK